MGKLEVNYCLFYNSHLEKDEHVYQYCPEKHFRCNDSQCVNEKWHCDGYKDCFDHSDEPPNCSKN